MKIACSLAVIVCNCSFFGTCNTAANYTKSTVVQFESDVPQDYEITERLFYWHDIIINNYISKSVQMTSLTRRFEKKA